MAARAALAKAVFFISRSSATAPTVRFVPRRGLAGGEDDHGPQKVDFWLDPLSPTKWKEGHMHPPAASANPLLLRFFSTVLVNRGLIECHPLHISSTSTHLQSRLRRFRSQMSGAAIDRKRVAVLGFSFRPQMHLLAATLRFFSNEPVNTNESGADLIGASDTVQRLEASGLPRKQAEAIASWIEMMVKAEIQQSEMLQNANISNLKSEIQSSMDDYFAFLQREIKSLHRDLRYEIDKTIMVQRMEVAIEKRRINSESAKQKAERSELVNKYNKEINLSKAQIEVTKYDVVRYSIGILVSLSGACVVIVRFIMS